MNKALKKDTFKKNVAIVHISNSITLLQRKAFNVLLLNAYNDLLTPNVVHEIDLNLFCSVMKYNSTNYPYLKETLKNLMTTLVEGDLFNDEGDHESWSAFTLLSHANIDFKKRTVSYEFSSQLAHKLYNPDVYTTINLSVQVAFNSKYALALYENCIRYRNLGSTGEIELPKLRKLLGVTSKIYEQYKEFNQKVLKKCVIEINKVSDIEITEVVAIRKGRSVSAIKFIFQQKKADKNRLINKRNETIKKAIYAELIMMGMDETWSLLTCDTYDEQYIREKLDYTKKENQKGKVESIKGFLYNAVKNDWKDEENEKAKAQQEKSREFNKIQAIEKKLEVDKANLLKEKQKIIREKVEAHILDITENDVVSLKKRFEDSSHMPNIPMKLRVYDKPMFKAAFHSYIYDVELGS